MVVKESLPVFSLDTKQDDYGFQRITSKLVDGKGECPAVLGREAIESYSFSKGSGATLFSREATLESDAKMEIEFQGIAYLGSVDWISLEAFLPTIDMSCTTCGTGVKFYGQPSDALDDMWEVNPTSDGENCWQIKGAMWPGEGFDIWFDEERRSD